jgi:phage shock protein PspC (stress-responsive transcriptional regulator)
MYEGGRRVDDGRMETDQPTPASPADGAPSADIPPRPRRLTRRRDDRMIAGVASGIADYFDVDPVLVRIGFVLLAIFGGSAFLLYGLGWLLLPEEDEDESIGESWLRDHRSARAVRRDRGDVGEWRPRPRGDHFFRRRGAVIFLIVAILVISRPLRFGWGGFSWAFLLVAAGAYLLLASGLVRLPNHSEPLTLSGPESFTGVPRVPEVLRAPPLTAPVVGILVVIFGGALLAHAVGIFTLSGATVVALALFITAVALLAGLIRGRIGLLWLLAVVLGIALAITAAVPVGLAGGAGTRLWRPASASELAPEYRLGAGDMTIDLRALAPGPQPARVRARLGVGHLVVILPPSTGVGVRARSSIGDIDVFGASDRGIDISRVISSGTAEPFDLDVAVGIGRVDIDQGPATS